MVDEGVFEGHVNFEPMRVEPLVMVLPLGPVVSGTKENRSFGRTPSDWVQRKHKGVRNVFGASYEGYEQTITELLMEIEAKHLQRKAGMGGLQRPSSSGRKCDRELESLVRSINYETRQSRYKGGLLWCINESKNCNL